MRAQQSLHVFLWIFGNLLELVNRDETRAVCLFEILEYLLKRQFGARYVAKTKVESRRSCYGVETELSAYGFQRTYERRHHLLALGQHRFVYLSSEEIGELLKTCGMQYVHEESIVFVFLEAEIIAVAYKPRLSHSSGGYKHEIVAVLHRPYYLA